jgi:hypothetical protein
VPTNGNDAAKDDVSYDEKANHDGEYALGVVHGVGLSYLPVVRMSARYHQYKRLSIGARILT